MEINKTEGIGIIVQQILGVLFFFLYVLRVVVVTKISKTEIGS